MRDHRARGAPEPTGEGANLTLADVAWKFRSLNDAMTSGTEHTRIENVIKAFEADPDFQLRERVEKEIRREEEKCLSQHGGHSTEFKGVCEYRCRAGRLRALLGGP